MKLFEVDKILCFKFHIDPNLSENKRKEYSAKIIKNGGEVIHLPADDVLTLTTKKLRDGLPYEGYDIKFIDDCLEAEKILDIGKYRFNGVHDYGCPMSLLLFGEKDCPVIEILRSRLSVTDTSSPTNSSPRAFPSTNSTQRVDPVEDYQLLRSLEPAETIETPQKKRQVEILENQATPKKSRNVLTSPTVVRNLEKRGVSVLRSSEKKKQKDIQSEDNSNLEIANTRNENKRVKRNLSLAVNDKGEIRITSRRKESESRIDEDEHESQEVDINSLVKQVTQGKKEKERRALERVEEEAKEKERSEEAEKKKQEKKEQERRKELERIEEERKEQERRDELERKKQEKKEQERKEQERRDELERKTQERKEQERKESEKKKQEEMYQRRKEQEIREELCRKEMELKRLEQEILEKLERERREYMEELERKEQELRKREKELEEKIEQEKKTKKKDAPLITKVVKVVLDRTIDSRYSGDSSLKSQSEKEIISAKRCLSFFDSEESLRECKRAKNGETQDSLSSMEKSSKTHETSDSIDTSSSEMRPFTQVPPASTQHSATDSNDAMFGSYEYQDEDLQNQAQFVNEKQLESAEMDSVDSERCKTVGMTQRLLDDLDSTVESLGNHVQQLSSQENVEESLEKVQEIQEKVQHSQDLMTEDESGPLLDTVSKAALLQDDSETDFESASDTPPNMNKNSDSDVTIVKISKSTDENVGTEVQENVEKSPMEIINVKRERNTSLEDNEDDDGISDAETIKLSQVRGRPDLIPKPTDRKKEARRKKKGKMAGLKTFLLGESQEQDDSVEEPRKNVVEENQNEEKENLAKSVQSGKNPAKNRWSAFFAP